MRDVLGHERYAVGASDFGSLVSAQLAHKYEDEVIALHLGLPIPLTAFQGDRAWDVTGGASPPADAPDEIRAGAWAIARKFASHVASHMFSSSTLSFGFADSPVGLLAYLVEKWGRWSDCDGEIENVFSKDDILTHAMIYWVNDAIGTSMRTYANANRYPWTPSHDRRPQIGVPTGITFVGSENPPGVTTEQRVAHFQSLPRAAWFNATNLRAHERGGHFIPWEVPDDWVADLRETVPTSPVNVRIFFLALGMAAAGMNSLLIAGLLPEIARALDTTEAVVGVSVAVYALTYAVTGPFIPIVFSRFSRRAILIAAMTLILCGIVLSAFAWDVWIFYVARAIAGLGTAAYTAQAMAAAMEISPKDRSGSATTWVGMGFAVSLALGVPVGTLLGDAFGYQVAFLLTGVIALIAIFGLTSVRVAVRADRPSLRQQFRPLTSPSVLAVMLAILLYSFSYFIVLTYLHPILVDGAGVDGTMVAAALAVFGVCNIVSMGVGGRLIDRFGGLSVVIVCVLVMGIATPLLGAPIGLVAFIAVAAFGLTGSLVGPASNVELGSMYPQNPATVVGANMSAVQLGAALGSAMGAAILLGPGASWIAYAAGPPALLAAGICAGIAIMRRVRRTSTAVTQGMTA